MTNRPDGEPAPLIPALGKFYEFARPFSWVVIRFGVGWNLAVHGYGKLLRGMEAQAKVLDVSLPDLHAYNLPLSYLLLGVEGLAACASSSGSSHASPPSQMA